MMDKILVYGFQPFLQWKHNITETIVKQLPQRENVIAMVLPVLFSPEVFLQPITEHQPKFIVGMGQHPRARKIRIERRAQNLQKDAGETSAKPIDKKATRHCFTTLRFPKNQHTTVTYNAGQYVCNFSMFTICQHLQQTNCQYGFLHIPKNISPKLVVDYLCGLFDGLQQDF